MSFPGTLWESHHQVNQENVGRNPPAKVVLGWCTQPELQPERRWVRCSNLDTHPHQILTEKRPYNHEKCTDSYSRYWWKLSCWNSCNVQLFFVAIYHPWLLGFSAINHRQSIRGTWCAVSVPLCSSLFHCKQKQTVNHWFSSSDWPSTAVPCPYRGLFLSLKGDKASPSAVLSQISK